MKPSYRNYIRKTITWLMPCFFAGGALGFGTQSLFSLNKSLSFHTNPDTLAAVQLERKLVNSSASDIRKDFDNYLDTVKQYEESLREDNVREDLVASANYHEKSRDYLENAIFLAAFAFISYSGTKKLGSYVDGCLVRKGNRKLIEAVSGGENEIQ